MTKLYASFVFSFSIALSSSAAIAQNLPQPHDSCLVGYPDGTFRETQLVTRYEFAAGLKACLDRVETQLERQTADAATPEEFANLQEQIQDFGEKLENLRDRIDRLE